MKIIKYLVTVILLSTAFNNCTDLAFNLPERYRVQMDAIQKEMDAIRKKNDLALLKMKQPLTARQYDGFSESAKEKFKKMDLALSNMKQRQKSFNIDTKKLYTTPDRTSWLTSLKTEKDEEIGYIKFSKQDNEGFIDLFHVDPKHRNKINDHVLMTNALYLLFMFEDVAIVFVKPNSFQHGSDNKSALDFSVIKSYYQNKYGFEIDDEDNKILFLTKEKYLRFRKFIPSRL